MRRPGPRLDSLHDSRAPAARADIPGEILSVPGRGVLNDNSLFAALIIHETRTHTRTLRARAVSPTKTQGPA